MWNTPKDLCGINQQWINECGKVVIGNIFDNKELIKQFITMKELISELSAIECSLLLVSTAIIITIILGLIMSGFNRD